MFDRLSFLRSSLGIKFLAPIVVLSAVVVAVGAVIGTQAMNEVLGERVRQRGSELASTVEHAVALLQDQDELQRFVAALAAREDVGLILVVAQDSDRQRVVASSVPEWRGQQAEEIPDERLPALLHTQGLAAGPIGNGGPLDFRLGIELPAGAGRPKVPGACLIRIQGERLQAERTSIFWQAAGYALCTALAVAVLAMAVFGVSTLRPLVELERVMRECAGGDLSVRAQITSDDELGSLAARFNALLDQLQNGQAVAAAHAAALEQAHQESEFLRRAIDRHAIISITDANGRIVAVNDQMCEISGYERSELLGQTHALVNSQVHDPEMWRAMYDDCSRGKSWRAEVCNRNKSGELYWIDTTITPLLGVDGKIERFIAISTDITRQKESDLAQKQMLQELEQASLAAEASSRAKSEFLANMSHEIRTPMTSILGYADLLLDEHAQERPAPARSEYIDTIRRHGHHLLEIVNDILDLSKIEAGKLTVEKLPLPLAQMVDDVVQLMRVRVASKPVQLVAELDPGLPPSVFSDPTRLRQILVNLLGNAIKFTACGSVALRVSRETRADGDPGLRFDVVDTGIGIPAEKLDQLFQPFSQTDSSMTRRFGGTGLGLAISRRLAEMLGGGITVVSQPGVGSTFSLLLPLEAAAAETRADLALSGGEPSARPIHEEPISLAGIRVLLAEDSFDNARLISHLLLKAEAAVEFAENGLLARQKILAAVEAGNPFDCVLMDMQMPELDGYQATQSLRDAGYRGSIIALTAHAMAGEREKCLAAGCDDYTTKPIDRQNLLAIVSQWGGGEKATGVVRRIP